MTSKSKSGKSAPNAPKKKPGGGQPMSGWVPAHFFQEQLKGEPALTYETAAWLYSLASQLAGVEPCPFFGACDLILLKDRLTGEMTYCFVMVSGDEASSFQVFRGGE